jgi:hypothetical protein
MKVVDALGQICWHITMCHLLKGLMPKFKVEIQLHTSCKQVEMSYILGGGNVYMWHDRMCYSRPYICCKVIVD